MPLLLLALFIGMPILEIAVFIEAGGWIGLWPTLAIVLLTGVAGTALLRIQGYGVVRRIREQMDQGRPPVLEMFEGLCLFAAGLLLLTPGFVTDTIGFLLFLPPLRKAIARLVGRRIQVQANARGFGPGEPPRGPHGPGGARQDSGGPVIDGEYETVEPDRDRLRS